MFLDATVLLDWLMRHINNISIYGGICQGCNSQLRHGRPSFGSSFQPLTLRYGGTALARPGPCSSTKTELVQRGFFPDGQGAVGPRPSSEQRLPPLRERLGLPLPTSKTISPPLSLPTTPRFIAFSEVLLKTSLL